jgi:hypothetical protein
MSAACHAKRMAAAHLGAAHRAPKGPAVPYAHYRALAEREARERGEWPLSEEEICRRAHHLALARSYQMAAARIEKAERSARAKSAQPQTERTPEERLQVEVRRLADEVGRLAGRLSLLEASR